LNRHPRRRELYAVLLAAAHEAEARPDVQPDVGPETRLTAAASSARPAAASHA
jgi:hypothetical protein